MKRINQYKLELFLLFFYSLLLVAITFLMISCKNSKNETISKNIKTKTIAKQTILKEKKDIENKPVIAQTFDVLVVNPSQKQLDSLQNTMSQDEYTTFVDESTFYINQAKEYCETIHSQIIEVQSGTPVLFESENTDKFPFSTHKLLWDIVIFNGKTSPEQIDVTNLQNEMMRVYNKAKQ